MFLFVVGPFHLFYRPHLVLQNRDSIFVDTILNPFNLRSEIFGNASCIRFFPTLDKTAISSFLCCSFQPLVTSTMLSHHAACLLSNVCSVCLWKTVGKRAKW